MSRTLQRCKGCRTIIGYKDQYGGYNLTIRTEIGCPMYYCSIACNERTKSIGVVAIFPPAWLWEYTRWLVKNQAHQLTRYKLMVDKCWCRGTGAIRPDYL